MRTFAERVRGCGVEVVLDQFFKDAHPGGPDEGWPKWSREQAKASPRVLVIGNTPWFRCFEGTEDPGVGLGAACEAHNLYQRFYDRSQKNDFMRVVYFDAADLSNMPLDLKGFDRFHTEDHFNEIIAWLGGSTPGVPPATVSTATLTWPARCATFVPNMANRHDEFAFFADTLCGATPQRATLVSAGTDHGKTKLVAEFHRYGREVLGDQGCAFVDFKGRGTVADIWDTLSLDLGSRLPGLTDRSPGKLREGLRSGTDPLLFSFDTFEQATDEARDFVEKHFLADLGRTNAMRLLIAGQPHAMPDPRKAAWEAHARRFDLGNIPDPQPWVDWAARAYPLIPASSVITIVAVSGGAPGTIANQLSTLGKYSAAQLKALGL